MRSPFADLLADLTGALDALGVPYYLFGAQAALLHGSARVTADVDLTVLPGNRSIRELSEVFRAAGFTLRIDDPTFTERTRVLPLSHTHTGIAADVVLGGPGLEELFLSRAVRLDFEGVQLPVASAEDLVVMKVLAGRPKDVEDVVAIVAAKGDLLDGAQVRETLRMLEEALDRSDLVPVFEDARRRAGVR